MKYFNVVTLLGVVQPPVDVSQEGAHHPLQEIIVPLRGGVQVSKSNQYFPCFLEGLQGVPHHGKFHENNKFLL